MPPTRVRVSRVLPLLLLCACLLPLTQPAAPAAGQTDAGQPAAIPANPERQLTLTVSAPIEEVAWGEAAAVTLVVANPGAAAVEGVALHLPRGRGLSWEDETSESGGPWLELGDLPAGASRTVAGQLRVEGVSRAGRLLFHVGLYGRDAAPVREKVVVRTPPPARETADVPAGGGEARLAGGRARLVFPPGWNERDARLGFQLEELYRQAPDETGRLLLFAVEAAGAREPFDAPVTVELQVGDLLDGPALPSAPGVTTRADDAQPWTAVESDYDPATGVLRFQAEHFSSYQVATEPEVWKLLYNPPGASAYSGAAAYSYPLQLPPGIAGLAPDLSLNYSRHAGRHVGRADDVVHLLR